MTTIHAQAVWALCREGLQSCADEAESRWRRGEPYHPDRRTGISRSLAELIRRGNTRLAARSLVGDAR